MLTILCLLSIISAVVSVLSLIILVAFIKRTDRNYCHLLNNIMYIIGQLGKLSRKEANRELARIIRYLNTTE